jgi:hypothetical protein
MARLVEINLLLRELRVDPGKTPAAVRLPLNVTNLTPRAVTVAFAVSGPAEAAAIVVQVGGAPRVALTPQATSAIAVDLTLPAGFAAGTYKLRLAAVEPGAAGTSSPDFSPSFVLAVPEAVAGARDATGPKSIKVQRRWGWPQWTLRIGKFSAICLWGAAPASVPTVDTRMVRRVLIVVAVLFGLAFLRNVAAAGFDIGADTNCRSGTTDETCLTDRFWYVISGASKDPDGEEDNPRSLLQGFLYWWQS